MLFVSRLLVGLAAALALSTGASAAPPETILVNGKIFTADPSEPYVEAAAIRAGRFTARGTSAAIRALAGRSTQVIDLGGRLVTPGLIEAHAHISTPPPGRFVPLPKLPFPGPTAEETLAGVVKAAAGGPGWLWGITGYPVFNDLRNWRDVLDRVAPNNPVMLIGCCGHAMMLNSRALEALGIPEDVKDPIGGRWGRDASGRLDGQAYEAATVIVTRRATPADPTASSTAAQLSQVAAAYARWGVTAVDQMADEATLGELRAALDRARLPIRWTVFDWGLPQASVADTWREVDSDADDWPPLTRLAGSKWILDGTPLEWGAFQTRDYADRPGWRGRSNYTAVQLREILKGALASRHQVALHVTGDAGAQMLLDEMAALAPPERWRAVRVRVEHGEGFFGPRLRRAAAYGLVIVQNPVHFEGLVVERGRTMQQARYGALAAEFQPLRSILAAGVSLGLGSDGANGTGTANPFLNMMIASSLPSKPGEALTREQTLTAYTAGNAFADRQEARRGKIAIGMDADLAVLSQDILTAPLPSLPGTTALLTMVAGKVVFADLPFATPPPEVSRSDKGLREGLRGHYTN